MIFTDDYFMREALRQARKAFEAGEVPVGAIIVQGDRIVGRAHNQVELLKDATAHAEMLAITQAQQALGNWRLLDCVLYATKEPCPMCGGAIVLSRIGHVVFGASDPQYGAAGGAMNLLQWPTWNHRCQITSGVMGRECSLLLKDFFRERRAPARVNGDGAVPENFDLKGEDSPA